MKKFLTLLLLTVFTLSFAVAFESDITKLTSEQLFRYETRLNAELKNSSNSKTVKAQIRKELAAIKQILRKNPPQKAKKGDTVSVNYVGKLDDGTVFDSNTDPGKSPLVFMLGDDSMIKWFDKAVTGMSVGQTKKVTLKAKDAYGEKYVEKTLPKDDYHETTMQTVPANALLGKLSQSIPESQVKEVFWTTTVGARKMVGDSTITIVSVDSGEVMVAIDDPKAPFYGKTLKVGMKAKGEDGNALKIISIDGDLIDIEIRPDQKIISKTATTVTVRTRNPHPLAGKNLTFEIELLSIEKN